MSCRRLHLILYGTLESSDQSREIKSLNISARTALISYTSLYYGEYNATFTRTPKICCIDRPITDSCTNNDVIMLTFSSIWCSSRRKHNFLGHLKHDKCHTVRWLLKEFRFRQWSCLSIDGASTRDKMIFGTGNLTHKLMVFKFSYLRKYCRLYILMKLINITLNK